MALSPAALIATNQGNKTFSGDITFTGDIIPSSPLSHRNLIRKVLNIFIYNIFRFKKICKI